MKKWLFLGLALLALVATLLVVSRMTTDPSNAGAPTSKAENETLVIGAILPLTGDAAAFGQNALRGAQLAVRQANEADRIPHTTITVMAQDSRGTAQDAVSAARTLIDVNGASLLIGDVTSAGTHALIPIVTRARVPLISPSASDPKLSGVSPFFARVWPSDVYEADILTRYVKKKGYHRIAAVFANTDYGVAMVDEVARQLGPDSLVIRVGFERETIDYRPTIDRIALSGCDALLAVFYPEDSVRLLQQLAERNVNLPILTTATFEDPRVAVEPGAERAVFASPVPTDATEPVRKTFNDAYQDAYDSEPGVLSDTGFDSVNILIHAYAETGGGSPEKIAKSIRALKDYQGASGKMTFNESGDVQKGYRMKRLVDGEFVWLPDSEQP